MNDLQKRICNAIVNIFEGSKITGNYGALGGFHNDRGHLSYGRSQVSLVSGNLYSLIKAYCDAQDAQFGSDLKVYLPRLAAKDITLDQDLSLRYLLKEAGDDPVMHREQDAYFERNFFQPALNDAQRAGLQQPLSQAIAYDTRIQGGWDKCSGEVTKQFGPVGPNLMEEQWISNYVKVRKNYLDTVAPGTGYRMDAFENLVAAKNWTLELPITIRSITMTRQSFADLPEPTDATPRPQRIPDPELDSLPVLVPQLPYLRGAKVLKLQQLLSGCGLKNSLDQIYGPFTQSLVQHFQATHNMKSDRVVGPQTWTALMAAAHH